MCPSTKICSATPPDDGFTTNRNKWLNVTPNSTSTHYTVSYLTSVALPSSRWRRRRAYSTNHSWLHWRTVTMLLPELRSVFMISLRESCTYGLYVEPDSWPESPDDSEWSCHDGLRSELSEFASPESTCVELEGCHKRYRCWIHHHGNCSGYPSQQCLGRSRRP